MATLDYTRWGDRQDHINNLGPHQKKLLYIRLDTVGGTTVLVWSNGTTSTLSTVA